MKVVKTTVWAVRVLAVLVLMATVLIPVLADTVVGCQIVKGVCVDVNSACANSGYLRWCGEGTHGEPCICNYPPMP